MNTSEESIFNTGQRKPELSSTSQNNWFDDQVASMFKTRGTKYEEGPVNWERWNMDKPRLNSGLKNCLPDFDFDNILKNLLKKPSHKTTNEREGGGDTVPLKDNNEPLLNPVLNQRLESIISKMVQEATEALKGQLQEEIDQKVAPLKKVAKVIEVFTSDDSVGKDFEKLITKVKSTNKNESFLSVLPKTEEPDTKFYLPNNIQEEICSSHILEAIAENIRSSNQRKSTESPSDLQKQEELMLSSIMESVKTVPEPIRLCFEGLASKTKAKRTTMASRIRAIELFTPHDPTSPDESDEDDAESEKYEPCFSNTAQMDDFSKFIYIVFKLFQQLSQRDLNAVQNNHHSGLFQSVKNSKGSVISVDEQVKSLTNSLLADGKIVLEKKLTDGQVSSKCVVSGIVKSNDSNHCETKNDTKNAEEEKLVIVNETKFLGDATKLTDEKEFIESEPVLCSKGCDSEVLSSIPVTNTMFESITEDNEKKVSFESLAIVGKTLIKKIDTTDYSDNACVTATRVDSSSSFAEATEPSPEDDCTIGYVTVANIRPSMAKESESMIDTGMLKVVPDALPSKSETARLSVRSTRKSSLVSPKATSKSGPKKRVSLALEKRNRTSGEETDISLDSALTDNKALLLAKRYSFSDVSEVHVADEGGDTTPGHFMDRLFGSSPKKSKVELETHLRNIYSALYTDKVTPEVSDSVAIISKRINSGDKSVKNEIVSTWIEMCERNYSSSKDKQFSFGLIDSLKSKFCFFVRPMSSIDLRKGKNGLERAPQEKTLIKEMIIRKFAREIIDYLADPQSSNITTTPRKKPSKVKKQKT